MIDPRHHARRRLRVGTVPYLVGRPLDQGLEDEPGIALVRRVPAELVALLRAGELDVALVSSIELFRTSGLRYIDGLAVAGDDFVGSVQVFLRKPIEDVRALALDPASRTAAALVRVLFARRGDGLPRADVDFVETDGDPRDLGLDAWLRIGDPALREHLQPGAPPVFNPSRAWRARTGLPFVFAVWIVRAGLELEPDELAAFARARVRGHAAREDLVRTASAQWRLPLEACRKYLLEECRYDPGSAQRPALLRFRDEAAALGLCRADLDPEPIALAHVT
jgi:chorismate dehydratase